MDIKTTIELTANDQEIREFASSTLERAGLRLIRTALDAWSPQDSRAVLQTLATMAGAMGVKLPLGFASGATETGRADLGAPCPGCGAAPGQDCEAAAVAPGSPPWRAPRGRAKIVRRPRYDAEMAEREIIFGGLFKASGRAPTEREVSNEQDHRMRERGEKPMTSEERDAELSAALHEVMNGAPPPEAAPAP
jgi:hypothetical protein